MTVVPDDVRGLDLISGWLARQDDGALTSPADVVVLCGSAVLATLDLVAQVVSTGLAPQVLITGGVGHSTRHLLDAVARQPAYADVATGGRSEAAILADLLHLHHGVPYEVMVLEGQARNCGENAAFSLALLDLRRVRSVLLVQDPTMQRRTHASFDRVLRELAEPVVVQSRAPFVPVLTGDAVLGPDGSAVWSLERFTGLVLGEVRRLYDTVDGYGPSGADFIDHVEVPVDVLSAYERLVARHPTRERWSP